MPKPHRPQRGPVDSMFQPANHARHRRKALQLGAQVREALHLALPECADALLQGLFVEDVQPSPGGHMLVTVVCRDHGASPAAVIAALGRAKPRLRAAVAQAITRRKAPELAFSVVMTREEEE